MFICLWVDGVWIYVYIWLFIYVQEKGKLFWEVSVDFIIVWGYVYVVGVWRDSIVWYFIELVDYGFGCFWGGWLMKIYVGVDVDCGVLFFVIILG